MKRTIDARPYQGTTAGQVAKVLEAFGFEFGPSKKRPEFVVATHRASGLPIFVYADFDAELHPTSVAGVRIEVETWEIASGSEFDEALMNVRKPSGDGGL